MGLTAVGAPVNFVLYALLLALTPLHAAPATVVAAMFVIVPKFYAAKYWVWQQNSRSGLPREASVFVAVTAMSLAFATFVAWALEVAGAGDPLLVAGNLGAFTVMWVLRFTILDRIGFRTADAAPAV